MGREQVRYLKGKVKNSADEYNINLKDLVPLDTILALVKQELGETPARDMQDELIHRVEQVVAAYINRDVQGLIGPGYDVTYIQMIHMIGYMQSTDQNKWNYPAYNASFTD